MRLKIEKEAQELAELKKKNIELKNFLFQDLNVQKDKKSKNDDSDSIDDKIQ